MNTCKYKSKNQYRSVKVVCTQTGINTQYTPVFGCTLHGKCLPTFRPKEGLYKKWKEEFKPESDIFHVCKYCPDFQK